jgi:hypothetical protein
MVIMGLQEEVYFLTQSRITRLRVDGWVSRGLFISSYVLDLVALSRVCDLLKARDIKT